MTTVQPEIFSPDFKAVAVLEAFGAEAADFFAVPPDADDFAEVALDLAGAFAEADLPDAEFFAAVELFFAVELFGALESVAFVFEFADVLAVAI